MIAYHQYKDYFETLARQHNSIGHSDSERHFFRSSIEEALGAISNRTIRYPAMMLLPLEIRQVGNTDNAYEKIYGGFMLLDALRKPEDHARRELIIDQTRIICEDIIQRIIHDMNDCSTPFGNKIFPEFEINDLVKKEWGPVWDNAFGWSYQFPVFTHYLHSYNRDVWNIS
jgi:hypothetical protein